MNKTYFLPVTPVEEEQCDKMNHKNKWNKASPPYISHTPLSSSWGKKTYWKLHDKCVSSISDVQSVVG